MTKHELLYYYNHIGLNSLDDSNINKLFKIIFMLRKCHPDPLMNYKYLQHSLKYPEIYKTIYN